MPDLPNVSITLDAGLLNLLIGVILPLLVATVTKRVTKSSVQRQLLIGLSLLSGALTSIAANGGSFDLGQVLTSIAVCYFTGQTAYSSVFKPTGITERLQGVGGIIEAADPEKVKALEGQPAEAAAAGEVLGDEKVEPVDAQPVDPAVDESEYEPVPPANGYADVDDDVPYDEDPDPDVPVLDPEVIPTEAPPVVKSRRSARAPR